MSNKRTNKDWPKLQEFMLENKNLFIVIADPVTDEMCISFHGLNGFVRFPSKDMSDGIVYNALRESKFEEAIDPFMAGVVKCSGIDVKTKAGNEVLNTIGGTIKSLGTKRSAERSKLEILPKANKKK